MTGIVASMVLTRLQGRSSSLSSLDVLLAGVDALLEEEALNLCMATQLNDDDEQKNQDDDDDDDAYDDDDWKLNEIESRWDQWKVIGMTFILHPSCLVVSNLLKKWCC